MSEVGRGKKEGENGGEKGERKGEGERNDDGWGGRRGRRRKGMGGRVGE